MLGYLDLGTSQSNMSNSRGYFACFFFLKCLCMVQFLYPMPQVNQFLGPELSCLVSLYTLNFQLRASYSYWFAVSLGDQYTF